MEKYKIVNISSYQLLALFNELEDDKSGYARVKSGLLEAWKHNHLYGIISLDDKTRCNKYLDNLLPCFCIIDGTTLISIWTHHRIRGSGFAKLLIQGLNLTKIYNPYHHYPDLWTHLGLTEINAIPRYHLPMYT